MSWRKYIGFNTASWIANGGPTIPPARARLPGPVSFFPVFSNKAQYSGSTYANNSYLSDHQKYTLCRIKTREFSGGAWTDLGWSAWDIFEPNGFMAGCYSEDSSGSQNEITLESAAGFGSVWKVDWEVRSVGGGTTYAYDSLIIHPGTTHVVSLGITAGKSKSVLRYITSMPG